MISYRQSDLLDQFNKREMDFIFASITSTSTKYVGPYFYDLDNATERDFAFARWGSEKVFELPGYSKKDDIHVIPWNLNAVAKGFEDGIKKHPDYIDSEIRTDPSSYTTYIVKVWYS